MKQILLIAGAAALSLAGAAIAKHGNGHGNPHAYGYDRAVGYGHGGCPPGLRNKNCMPPGQAKKLARGQRWQSQYGSRYAYGQIPYSVRNQYDLNPRYNYYYNNGYLYQVDPRTQLVQQVIGALLGR